MTDDEYCPPPKPMDNAYRERMAKATAELCAIVREYGLMRCDWGQVEGIDYAGRLIRHRVRIEGYEPKGPKAEAIKRELTSGVAEDAPK